MRDEAVGSARPSGKGRGGRLPGHRSRRADAQRQAIWFFRLSPLLAVTRTSVDQEVVPSLQDPPISPSRARCWGSTSRTLEATGVPDPVPFTVVVTLMPPTRMAFFPSLTR